MAATPDSIPESEGSDEAAPTRHQQEVLDSDIKIHAAFYHSKVYVTSAKTGIGVKQLFASIAEDLALGAGDIHVPQARQQHVVRPVSPHYLQSRPGTNPASPLGSSHNSTYSRTKRKYLPSCCC